MVFLWYPVVTILQKALVDKCVHVSGKNFPVIADIGPDKNPMTRARAVWLNTMGKRGLAETCLTSNGVLSLCSVA